MTGNTATLVFATTGAVGDIISIGGLGFELPDVEKSVLATANFEKKAPGDLAEISELPFTVEYDPDLGGVSLGVVETVTLTFPVPAGKSTGATVAGTAYLKRKGFEGLANNERTTGEYALQFDGITGPTFTPSA